MNPSPDRTFSIERPSLHDYAAVSAAGMTVETYRSDAGVMTSAGSLHRLSINRSAHVRYASRMGDAGPVRRLSRPAFTLGFQPAGVPLFVDGDAADYISIFQSPETYRDVAEAGFRPEELDVHELLVPTDPATLNLVLALAATTRARAETDPLVAESLALALAACTVRLVARRPVAVERADPSPAWLGRVVDHVEARLGEDGLSLAAMAAVAGLSPFHFSRAFKRATGVAPHRFVIRRRIARAKALLARPDVSLVEIAYAAGFANQAHFTTLFRLETGVTPLQYRRAL